jgi:hypothetical protein
VPVPPGDSPAAAWQTAPAREEEGVHAGEEAAEEAAEPAAAEAEEEEEEAQADGFAEEDPYATGGFVRRVQEEAPPPAGEPADEERPFTTFDWRGRPLS